MKLLLLIISIFFFLGCPENPPEITVSNSTELHDALLNAEMYATINLKKGTYYGEFNVSKALSIVGESREETILKHDETVFKIQTSFETIGERIVHYKVYLQNLTVEGSIVGETAFENYEKYSTLGELIVKNVDVKTKNRMGIASSTSITCENVTITGDKQNSKYGLFIGRSGTLQNVQITGMTKAGIYQGSSSVGISNSQITDNNIGIISTYDSYLYSDGLKVKDNNIGIMLESTAGENVNLIVENNKERGLWVQYTHDLGVIELREDDYLIIKGESRISDNNGVGLGLYQAENVIIDGIEISNTKNFSEFADGLTVFDSKNVLLKNTVLTNNQRAGVIVENSEIEFENVIIDGEGERGFVLSSGTVTSEPVVIDEDLTNESKSLNLLEPFDVEGFVN